MVEMVWIFEVTELQDRYWRGTMRAGGERPIQGEQWVDGIRRSKICKDRTEEIA